MSSRSISSAKTSGVHLKQSRGLSSPSMAKIFPRILKQRSSPHCRFSVASGKERQYARMESTPVTIGRKLIPETRASHLFPSFPQRDVDVHFFLVAHDRHLP